jgi:hypothetical protein
MYPWEFIPTLVLYVFKYRICEWLYAQSTQSAGPVRFFTFRSISIFLLASLVAVRRPQCTLAGNVQYSTIPIHLYIKSPPASPGKSRVGPALYVFSLLGYTSVLYCTNICTVSLRGLTREKKERLEVRRIPDSQSLVDTIDRVHHIVVLLLHSWSNLRW